MQMNSSVGLFVSQRRPSVLMWCHRLPVTNQMVSYLDKVPSFPGSETTTLAKPKRDEKPWWCDFMLLTTNLPMTYNCRLYIIGFEQPTSDSGNSAVSNFPKNVAYLLQSRIWYRSIRRPLFCLESSSKFCSVTASNAIRKSLISPGALSFSTKSSHT